MSRPAYITIHSSALRHNFLVAKQAAPHSKIMPAVKANAYGHGMINVASSLADIADGFLVACLSEALELRDEKITAPLLVIQGPQSISDLKVAVEKNIRLVIHDESQLILLADFSSRYQHRYRHPLNVALKLDTGMHRLGIKAVKTKQFYAKLKAFSCVGPDIWLMTHLACADVDNDYTQQQIDLFNLQTESLTGTRTLANSAGILAWQESHQDWVRPGIMIYGASPINGTPREQFDLRAAMTFSAPLIAIHRLTKGDAIGYGATWVCPENMKVGVVAAGYADGYPRHAPSGTPVFVNGKKSRILGRISMDLIVIDLRGIEASPSHLVELWGNHISIDEIALAAETISYELLCHADAVCQKSIEPS